MMPEPLRRCDDDPRSSWPGRKRQSRADWPPHRSHDFDSYARELWEKLNSFLDKAENQPALSDLVHRLKHAESRLESFEALEKRVAALEAEQKSRVALQAKMPERLLTTALSPSSERSPTALDWIEQHFEELDRYAGQDVAIDPLCGVVAHASSMDALYDVLEEKGIGDEVTLYRVPIGPVDGEEPDGSD